MRRYVALLVLSVFLASVAAGGISAKPVQAQTAKIQIAQVSDDRGILPPNEDKIARTLMAKGVIPANATDGQVEQAVRAYVQLKMKKTTSERAENVRLA